MSAPSTLSSALCLPTSSRTTTSVPSGDAHADAWIVFVSLLSGCWAPSDSLARQSASRKNVILERTRRGSRSASSMTSTPQRPQPVRPTIARPRVLSRSASAAGISIWSSIPRLYFTTSTRAMSPAPAIASVTVKPTPKSSRSAGVHIMTACGRPLYTSATGTSAASGASLASLLSPSSRAKSCGIVDAE